MGAIEFKYLILRKYIYFLMLNSIRYFSLVNNDCNAELSFKFFLLNVTVQHKWYNNKTKQPDITRAPFKRSFQMIHARRYSMINSLCFCFKSSFFLRNYFLLILFEHLFCVCQKIIFTNTMVIIFYRKEIKRNWLARGIFMCGWTFFWCQFN